MRPSGCHAIHLYDQAVDMRKSFEGLSALVEATFPGKLLTGSLFLFLNRRRNLIKILYWEGDGFAIFSGRQELTRQQFVLLLEGVVPKRISRRFSL